MARPKRDPKNPNLKTWLTRNLRRCSYRWVPRNEALKSARIERGLYKCAMCSGEFRKEDIKLDHIQPVVNIKTGFTTWDEYILRMFCNKDGYQCLCEACHDSKTAIEDELRLKYRQDKKKLDKDEKEE